MEGVVRAPSEFSITRHDLPSIMATQLFVVPRSMPQMSARSAAEARRPRSGADEAAPPLAAAAAAATPRRAATAEAKRSMSAEEGVSSDDVTRPSRQEHNTARADGPRAIDSKRGAGKNRKCKAGNLRRDAAVTVG